MNITLGYFMVSAISVKNLSKWYGNFQTLNDVSFSVTEGEFFGFLGPNGAGKTTTINSITGLSTFEKGEIEVLGHNVVSDYRNARKLIGLSQQDYNFDDFFTVEKILKFQAGYFGFSGKEAQNIVDKVLAELNLASKRKVQVIELSGGMKRRLMLAKALVVNPKILILDEPTTGVDVELRHELWDLLKRLNQKGTTIFLTTHYIEEAENLCDRICIINKGHIVEMDKTRSLKRKYSRGYVELELEKENVKLPNQLIKYHPVIEKHIVKMECSNAALDLEFILKALRESNIKVVRILVGESTLESIYLELTK